MEALTKENILSAFCKTGVIPCNWDMITEQMMAPSATTSTHATLPIPQASPVHMMQDMIHRHLARQAVSVSSQTRGNGDIPLVAGPSSANEPTVSGTTPTRVAVSELASTSASFLVSASPPQSTMTLPAYKPYTISPFKQSHYADILEREPATMREQELRDALQEAEQRDAVQKHIMVGMQATVLLQGMYVAQTQQHLQEHEQRKQKKVRKRVFGDGMPKLLDGDEFFARVTEHEAEIERGALDKEERRAQREGHAESLVTWKTQERERIARNKAIHDAHQHAVKAWEEEHDAAKLECQQARWTKPKQGPLEKPIPRPKKPNSVESESEDERSSIEDAEMEEAD
jgi:hypothetical protein